MDGRERYAYAGKVRLIRDQRHACFKAAQAPRAISAGATNGQTRRPIQSYVVVVVLQTQVSLAYRRVEGHVVCSSTPSS